MDTVSYADCVNWTLFVGGLHYVCNICNRTYKCGSDGVTSLKRHGLSQVHYKKAAAVKTLSNLFEICQSEARVEKRAQTLELQAAMFIVQKNLPISIADDFIKFLKTIDINEKIQKKLWCRRTKCHSLICNVLGRYSESQLLERLRQGKFSIMIDEATDISMKKHLAICVWHLSPNNQFTVEDNFLALLEVIFH